MVMGSDSPVMMVMRSLTCHNGDGVRLTCHDGVGVGLTCHDGDGVGLTCHDGVGVRLSFACDADVGLLQVLGFNHMNSQHSLTTQCHRPSQ